ncbi:MAG: hypothetical protein LUD47_05305 [Clostridia bacterium]|nr:hypothetical protein [Clostridia bacterium]
MASSKKEMEKKRLVKETISSMTKQIEKLEDQKELYIEKGKEAKAKGLTNQYELALSGLKMTITQIRRMEEMKLNFEITSQMRDMSQMTVDFLKGMGSLSREMSKLTNEKTFLKVQKEFTDAMTGVETQMADMDAFMSDTSSAFKRNSAMSPEDTKAAERMIDAPSGEELDDEIEKEFEELKKLMG